VKGFNSEKISLFHTTSIVSQDTPFFILTKQRAQQLVLVSFRGIFKPFLVSIHHCRGSFLGN